MFKEPNLSKALEHRRQAADCGPFAANAQSAEDRTLLLHMQRLLLDRADRLDGLPPGLAAATEGAYGSAPFVTGAR